MDKLKEEENPAVDVGQENLNQLKQNKLPKFKEENKFSFRPKKSIYLHQDELISTDITVTMSVSNQ